MRLLGGNIPDVLLVVVGLLSMPIQGIGATKEAGIVPYIQDFFTAEHAQSIQSQWGKLASILVPAEEAITPDEEIGDCCCDANTVQKMNRQHFLPILNQLTERVFFRFFKVDLWKPCPFWPDDGQCAKIDCSVCVCSLDDIPEAWRGEFEREIGRNQQSSYDSCPDDYMSVYEAHLAKIKSSKKKVGRDFAEWRVGNNMNGSELWIVQDEASANIRYVDLHVNPEGYTGYDGPNARRLWQAIYDENCFLHHEQDMCFEERVFFRLLSGLQSSINTHIALTVNEGEPSLRMWKERVGNHPERLRNLYFTYLFLVRSIVRGESALLQQLYSGNEQDDKETNRLMHQLLQIDEPLIEKGFDEESMFKIKSSEFLAATPELLGSHEDIDKIQKKLEAELAFKQELKKQFQAKFRNISMIMDCVGCEKCRLWGKLQFLGLGTALRLMFTEDVNSLELEHNEVVALINTLHRLSLSLAAETQFRRMDVQIGLKVIVATFAGAFVGLGVIAFMLKTLRRPKEKTE